MHQEDFKSVHAPTEFGSNSSKYLNECLSTTWVSSGGGFVNKFAEKLAQFINIPFLVPVSSGTAALKLALKAIDVERGEEVLVPSFTFVASANAVSHIGAVPHFVDIESKTFGIDPIKLDKYLSKKVKIEGDYFSKKTGSKISTYCGHVYGNSCNILDISKVCKKYNIKLIEDCAGALGTFVEIEKDLRHVGRFGEIGCLSFNGNKIITTGGRSSFY